MDPVAGLISPLRQLQRHAFAPQLPIDLRPVHRRPRLDLDCRRRIQAFLQRRVRQALGAAPVQTAPPRSRLDRRHRRAAHPAASRCLSLAQSSVLQQPQDLSTLSHAYSPCWHSLSWSSNLPGRQAQRASPIASPPMLYGPCRDQLGHPLRRSWPAVTAGPAKWPPSRWIRWPVSSQQVATLVGISGRLQPEDAPKTLIPSGSESPSPAARCGSGWVSTRDVRRLRIAEYFGSAKGWKSAFLPGEADTSRDLDAASRDRA